MKLYRLSERIDRAEFEFTVGKAKVTSHYEEHTHDFCELVIILGGMARHTINGQSHYIKAGDIYVMNPGTSHGFYDAHDLYLCNVMYMPAMLSHARADLKSLPGYQSLFVLGSSGGQERTLKCILQVSLKELKHIDAELDLMITELGNRQGGYETRLVARFLDLVVRLSRAYIPQKEKQSDTLWRLASTVGYMEQHYCDPITLEELATRCGLSRRQFIRLFRENYHSTPIDYVLDLRLARAAALLQSSADPLTHIAMECGFSDSNYFTRLFRRRLGMTPTRYRQQVR